MHVSQVSSNESTVEPSFLLIRASHYSLGSQTYLAWGNTTFKHEICLWQLTRFGDIMHEIKSKRWEEVRHHLVKRQLSGKYFPVGMLRRKWEPLKKNYRTNNTVFLPDNSPVRHIFGQNSKENVHSPFTANTIACVRSPHPKTLRCLPTTRA